MRWRCTVLELPKPQEGWWPRSIAHSTQRGSLNIAGLEPFDLPWFGNSRRPGPAQPAAIVVKEHVAGLAVQPLYPAADSDSTSQQAKESVKAVGGGPADRWVCSGGLLERPDVAVSWDWDATLRMDRAAVIPT